MSSLWTPGGERPVPGDGSAAEGRTDPTDLTSDQEQLLGELQAAREQLANTPASVVVANHAIGLFQLAAIHLDREPPNLEDARLAIDALAAIVDGLEGRLGEEEDALREARAQLQLAYVHVAGGSQ
ncbi:MAG: hypothetical protein QOD30_2000 [Actinomycetota bacterium]|jgi:hypothetical protein|nr:hypothetical protein [Actinomycetota bacterium]